MPAGSLTIVGTGIRLGQLTFEARVVLEHADKLLYLVADPLTQSWILRTNGKAESLEHLYARGKNRLDTYRAMVERILACVREGLEVCVAFYGHPGVFVYPSHEAIRLARLEGFSARMLPGISALDCLFADLGVDPATTGCQSYEATDFLIHRRQIDTGSALILWQIGAVGQVDYRRKCNSRGLAVLVETLGEHYAASHPTVIYEASQFPICDPVIERVPLASIPRARVTHGSTLYLPPKSPARPDLEMIERLKMTVASLKK